MTHPSPLWLASTELCIIAANGIINAVQPLPNLTVWTQVYLLKYSAWNSIHNYPQIHFFFLT